MTQTNTAVASAPVVGALSLKSIEDPFDQLQRLMASSRDSLTTRRDQLLAELNDIQKKLDWLDGMNKPARRKQISFGGGPGSASRSDFALALRAALESQKGRLVHVKLLYEVLRDQGVVTCQFHSFRARVAYLVDVVGAPWIKRGTASRSAEYTFVEGAEA